MHLRNTAFKGTCVLVRKQNSWLMLLLKQVKLSAPLQFSLWRLSIVSFKQNNSIVHYAILYFYLGFVLLGEHEPTLTKWWIEPNSLAITTWAFDCLQSVSARNSRGYRSVSLHVVCVHVVHKGSPWHCWHISSNVSRAQLRPSPTVWQAQQRYTLISGG